jgi:EmrB/QacA subfamily drug resistance transporter
MTAAIEFERDRRYRLRWWTLVVLSVSLLIIIADDTIINVALPTLARAFGGSSSSLQWVVDAYILVFGGLLLTMGTLGDRFGRRRLLQAGLVLFGAASLFGAYSASTAELVLARAAMGAGGAMIMPATLSILVGVFPQHERVRAIGIWAAIAHLGIPLGPIVGGWLVEHAWWGSVLLINVPIVVIALVAGRFLVPESRHPSPRRLDLGGMVASTAALVALVYAIIEGPSAGWSSPRVLGGFAVALLAGAWFARHERRVAEPMLDLRLFGNPRLRWGLAAITVAIFTLAGLMFNLTQFLQLVQGRSPLGAGVRIVPLVLGFAVAAHLGQHLVSRVGTGRAAAAGFLTGAVLLFGVAHVGPGTAYPLLGAGLFLLGIALGVVFIPSTDAVMAAFPGASAGLGAGLNDTSRQIGAALGVAVLGSLTNAVYTARLGGPVTGIDPGLLAQAKRSLAAALQLAPQAGQAGEALAAAARGAFTDGFSLAALAGAALLAATGVLVWRRLPASDLAGGGGERSPLPHGHVSAPAPLPAQPARAPVRAPGRPAAPGVARAQDRPRQGRVPNLANEPERKWYR